MPQEERRRIEEEENKLNITVKVMTEEAMAQYHGLDLLDWETAPKIKVCGTWLETYATLRHGSLGSHKAYPGSPLRSKYR